MTEADIKCEMSRHLQPLDVRNVADIERGLSAFSPGRNDGMVVTATPLAALYREQIISLAA